MSRWFRWYEGTSEDGKFRVVARLSRVTVRDAIALWAFMLEDAAHLEHRGVCLRNEDFMASILDFEDGVVDRILSAMESAGMISVGPGGITICNWCKRQFEGDTDPTAAERQARKRERDKVKTPVTNGPVTRDSRPPDTDTDTDTDSEKKEDTRAERAWSFNQFWLRFPNKVGKRAAEKAFDRVRKSGRVTFDELMVGLERYVHKSDDRPWCNPATWLNQERWSDQPAAPSRGPPRGGFLDLALQIDENPDEPDCPPNQPLAISSPGT